MTLIIEQQITGEGPGAPQRSPEPNLPTVPAHEPGFEPAHDPHINQPHDPELDPLVPRPEGDPGPQMRANNSWGRVPVL